MALKCCPAVCLPTQMIRCIHLRTSFKQALQDSYTAVACCPVVCVQTTNICCIDDDVNAAVKQQLPNCLVRGYSVLPNKGPVASHCCCVHVGATVKQQPHHRMAFVCCPMVCVRTLSVCCMNRCTPVKQ